MIHPKSHPTYNERHQKIIEMINIKMTNQEIEEEEEYGEEEDTIDYVLFRICESTGKLY
jgi:hypothetical protein